MRKFTKRIDESTISLIDPDIVDTLVSKLQKAFAEEINAWYGYIIVSKFLVGKERSEIAEFFEDAAKDEYEDHAMWLLERINQLGKSPIDVLTLNSINNIAPHKYICPFFCEDKADVMNALKINLKNEEGAIETYNDLEKFTRDIDVVTNRKIKDILGDEQEHHTKIQEFIDDLSASGVYPEKDVPTCGCDSCCRSDCWTGCGENCLDSNY